MFFSIVRKIIGHSILVLPVLLAFLPIDLYSQSSKQTVKIYKKYLVQRAGIDSVNTDSLSKLIKQIIEQETAPEVKTDRDFLLKLTVEFAALSYRQHDYKNASVFYKIALNWSREKKDTVLYTDLVYRFLAAFNNYLEGLWSLPDSKGLRYEQWLKPPGSVFTQNMATEALRILKKPDSDTVFFVLKGGLLNGLAENSSVSVYTTFDTFFAISRSSVLAGSGKILDAKDLFSIGFVKLRPGFRDTLFDKDCWIVRVNAPQVASNSQFRRLFLNNIKIRSFDKNRFYTQGWGNLLLDDTFLDLHFVKALREELISAENHYSQMDSNLFGERMKKGRYAGFSYREVVHQTTEAEIRVFLDFILSYPAKYINKKDGWSFVEIYLTWVLNDCPLGDDKAIAFNALRELTEQEWINKPAIWQAYYNNLCNADSLFNDYLNEQLSDNPVAQKELYEHLLRLTSALSLLTSYDQYAYGLIWKYYELHEYAKAMSLCDNLLGRKSAEGRKREVFFLKAACLNSMEEPAKAIHYFDSSLKLDPGFYYATGQKGWALTKMMNLNEASPLCKAAFEADSQSSWTLNNYANVQFLSGNTNEALRLYKKALETLSSESEFYSNGVMGDLNYFLKKGLQVQQIQQLKVQLNDLFTTRHMHRVRADSLFRKASAHSGKKRYRLAIDFYNQSLQEEMKFSDIRWGQVRMLNRYLGFFYHKIGAYQTSLEYYSKALEISKNKELGGDAVLADMNAIAVLYDWLNDSVKHREFEARASALEVSINEKRQSKRLFALLVGAQTNGINDQFAIRQLYEMDSLIRSSAENSFDSISIVSLAANNCTAKNLIDEIDRTGNLTRPSDVFLFFYAGNAGSTGREDFLSLTDGQLNMPSLLAALDMINAGRQIHIADCDGLDWRKHYSSANLKQLSHAQKSLFFLGNKSVRIEDENGSLLGMGLKMAHQKLSEKGELSAASWLSESIAGIRKQDKFYPFELLVFGHDFTFGRYQQAYIGMDTTAPVIELPGAQKTRGEAISIVTNRLSIAGSIIDNSKIVSAFANNIKLKLSPTGRFEIPSSLAQNGRITITATDEYHNSVTETFELQKDNSLDVGEGTRYAFFIASDNYRYWSKLNNPIFDAVETGKILSEHYGYRVEIDSNFTHEQVLDKLESIRRMSFRPKDQLFVYVAGHGVYDSIRQGHFVCVDSRPLEEDRFYKTYVRQKEIADMLDGTNCKNVLLLMDICYGGRMFDKQQIVSTGWLNDRYSKSVDEFIGEKLDIPCRQFLTSGGNNEVFDGDAGAHSPFCSRIMKVLDSAVDNPAIPFVTASGLMTYLRSMKTIGNDYKSYPRYGSFGGSSEGEYVFKVRKHRVILRRSE